MPIRSYSVVKGSPEDASVKYDAAGRNPHYHIHLRTDAGDTWDVAVNIESQDGSEVLYLIDDNFTPPNAGLLDETASGLTPLDNVAGGLALDYVREGINGAPMVDRTDMALLPIGVPARDAANDLHNGIVDLFNRAKANGGIMYTFGSAYANPNGIHDIHMNQGNPLGGGHEQDNGVWQDGALFVQFTAEQKWSALFIAFQTESWRTDADGNPTV